MNGETRRISPRPVTLSFDLAVTDSNNRSYLRSALERFHWRRLGGSVFRYDGVDDGAGGRREDWLNHVIPALMFLRSFIQKKGIKITFLTIDAFSVACIDQSDPNATYGEPPQTGDALTFAEPTNVQSAEKALRTFIDGCTNSAP